MRLINLEIHNLRGIQNGSIVFPVNNRFVCLIGAGDTTKSTILLAIEWLFSKTWNLSINDNDFYNGNTSSDIVIYGTFTEFPEAFVAEDKYGLYLRKPEIPVDDVSDDEPQDGLPLCLTIRFTVDNTLEPHWDVVCNRLPPKAISHKERSRLSVGVVGENCSKDLTWGRFSILQRYADAKGVLHDAYTKAIREATGNVDLKDLDAMITDVGSIGSQYGVGFVNAIKNKLLVQNGSFSVNAGLFDGDVPLSLRGRGSQRLLSMGLNVTAYADGVVLLIDEIERGLEPYRLRSLINQLRHQVETAGQVIITTHSPVVLTECNVSELMTVHSKNGDTTVYAFGSGDPVLYEQFQRQIRNDADAFLCKALIVCEGKTEIGFIKALDDYIAKSRGYRMAYKGIGTALGNGDTTLAYADALKNSGYIVSVFIDSDKCELDTEKETRAIICGMNIFDWDKPNSIEQQLFLDLPDALVQKLLDVAVEEKGVDSISSSLRSKDVSFTVNDDNIILEDYSAETRAALGLLSKAKAKKVKNGEWYKRIDLGRQIGQIVFDNWSEITTDTKLHKTVSEIIKWIEAT